MSPINIISLFLCCGASITSPIMLKQCVKNVLWGTASRPPDCLFFFTSQGAASLLLLLGHPKPKMMLIFRFVGIFEYIILLILILFLDMCQNS